MITTQTKAGFPPKDFKSNFAAKIVTKANFSVFRGSLDFKITNAELRTYNKIEKVINRGASTMS
jgi:hypothetical protein